MTNMPQSKAESGAVQRPRRWFRFSLRAMLLVVTLVAIWLGITVNQIQTQRAAVRQIQAAGGNVMFDYHNVAPRTISTSGRPRGPEWLRKLFGPELFDRPVWVTLFDPPDEHWVDGVVQLPSIKYLLLSGEHVTDENVARLSGMTNLWELHLIQSSISDEALRTVGQLSSLRWLTITTAKISDTGIADLQGLKNLEELRISNVRLTDAAVAPLSMLKNLSKLEMSKTGLSAEGLRQLRDALTSCQISLAP